MLTYDPSTAESTALAVFNQGGNAEYPYDSGLYFYPEEANLEYDLVEDMRNNVTGANKGSEPKENTDEESNEVSFLPNYNIMHYFLRILRGKKIEKLVKL